MLKRIRTFLTGLACCALLLILLAGCKTGGASPTAISSAPSTSSTTPAESTTPESSSTPAPTDVPLAVRVDGFGISLAEYKAELAQYQASKGTDLSADDKTRVLDDLIDQALLAKGAQDQGYSVDEALLDERINTLKDQLGSEQNISDWKAKYGYDEPTFRKALSRSIASAWMRDQIASTIPKIAEQVHIRQILLYNSEQADEIYQQLQSGNSFETLAEKYDPVTGGDLGWFPKGYLPDKEIEDAAFGLQLEQYSSIIKTSAGYHILQLLERDPARALSPDALLVLQTQAVKSWLEQQREKSQIEILLP